MDHVLAYIQMLADRGYLAAARLVAIPEDVGLDGVEAAFLGLPD
jgi:hypothetical protein